MSIMEKTAESASLVSMLSDQMADAVERISKAVVLVNGRQRQPASGVVYGQDLVVTADHVLEREEDLTVQTADNRKLPAQLAGRDMTSDLAVLRVPGLGLEKAMAAAKPARVGQLILAVGRPSPEGVMASIGIVSAIGGPLRSEQGLALEQFIRTDAIPYPGFSGGPLIDVQGAVLGITTTGLVGGVALIVPAAIAWQTAETLAQHGFIKRGFLGVSCQPVQLPPAQRGGRPQEHGLLVIKVEENSPAQRGGLLLGDIMVLIEGQPVTDGSDLRDSLTGDRVGKPIAIEVIRGGETKTLPVTVGQRG